MAILLEPAAVETTSDDGTGCIYSAALAVHLARGSALVAAVRHAHAFVAEALTVSVPWVLDRGRGLVAHVFTHPYKEN
ncbi:hypothetical protein GCM10027596_40850 [Nocardioides korecus]